MINSKYLMSPFLMEDDDDEQPKEDKQEPMSPLLVKKMEKIIIFTA